MLGKPVYQVNNINLELDPTSFIDRRLIAGQGHDIIVAELIQERLCDGGVFVDVGANIGYFSLMAAGLPDVHVLAFEPSPRELSRLYTNLTLNHLPGTITVYPYGLSGEACSLPLHLSSDVNPMMNSVADLGQFMKYVETVQCYFMPFDDLVPPSLANRVRLCKIDVEGYEVPVLQGFSSSIDEMPDAAFIVEISPSFLAQTGNRPCQIYEFFESHGFVPRIGPQEEMFQYNEVFDKPSRP